MHIESFEIGCKKLSLDPNDCLPDVSKVPAKHQTAVTSFTKLCIITEAANESKDFDWENNSQYKYLPWFDMEVDSNNPSGFRFLGSLSSDSISCAGSGSRLCFFTRNDSDYHGKKHESLYKDVMVFLPAKKKTAKKK